jgi:uncharacterized protein (TIGR00251 family)
MIELHEKGTVLHIRVKSQAREQSIRIADDMSECLVSVKAAPIRGQANRAVVKILAKKMGIPSQQVMIISGVTSQSKTLLISGMTPSDVKAALQT